MSVRWDPFRDLITLQEHLNRLFDVSVSQHRHQDGMTGWHPPSDVCESENEVCVYVEIPGMAPDRFDLRVEGNHLTLRGERYRPQRRQETYHQTEILMGPFHRTFVLPSNVDPEKIQANYRQGILEIILPKVAERVTQTVPIKVK